MKDFLLRVLLFSIILLGILFLIKQTVPYYFGNELMTQKIRHIESVPEDYNCIFIGSSNTHRHLIPDVFDDMTGLNSYNLGCSGMFFLETHYILENFIKKNPSYQNSTVFLQNLDPTRIADKNLHSLRSKYFLDFKRLKIALNYFGKKNKYDQIYVHLLSFMENKLCIGELRDIINFHLYPQNPIPPLMADQRGYYSLDQEKTETKMNPNIERIINKRKDKVFKIKNITNERVNIKNGDSIEFFNINKPKLPIENYFDKGHFNSKGAKIYTEIVAKGYNKKK